MKSLFRRIAAGIIILSFFLPWFDLWLIDASGFTFIIQSITMGSDFGYDEAIILGIVILVILLLAIWTLIQPKVLPTTLLLVISTIMLVIFYTIPEMAYIRAFGMHVLALGVIGVYVSLFVKNERSQPKAQTVANQPYYEMAAARENAPMEQPRGSAPIVKQFCSECGTKLIAGNRFCKDCGSAV